MKVGNVAGHKALWSGPAKKVTCSPSGPVEHGREWGDALETCPPTWDLVWSSFFPCLLHAARMKWSYLICCATKLSADWGFCWKSIQTEFKSNAKISSKDKTTLRDRTNIIQCKREKIQIRCRERDIIPHLILCSYDSLLVHATCAGKK